MSLRSVPTRWFELLTARDDVALTMECLSHTGAVQLETNSEITARLPLPDLRGRLDEYGELAQRYQAYWPAFVVTLATRPESPVNIMDRALDRVRAWVAAADAMIVPLQRMANERGELELLERFLAHASPELPDLHLLAGAGPALRGVLYLLPGAAWPQRLPPSVIHRQIEAAPDVYLLAVGPQAEVEGLEEQLRAIKARAVELPDWLPATGHEAIAAIETRLAEIETSSAALEADLERLSEECGLPGALGDLVVLQWFAAHARDLPTTTHFVWVTGWSSDVDGRDLEAALQAGKVRYLLHFPRPPGLAAAPMVLRNPRWAQPFELFVRMLGTPGANEADPSRVVAFIAPLLFGYMFGDVGQGCVLVLVGMALRHRLSALRVLIPGGIMSIVFGFLFGSIFGREDVLPALWLHPLDEPVTVLVVALAVGAAILTLGLMLDAVQAHWRGEGSAWWHTRAGLVIAYLGLLAAVLQPAALWITAAGALWFLWGTLEQSAGARFAVAGKAFAQMLESLVQLVVNTISFARVGAFALAHAGLSAAIAGVADATGVVVISWLVMLLGNVLVIALEGLVVGVQTTRLLLFEFFIRFLCAGGREFHPLPPPTFPMSKDERVTP